MLCYYRNTETAAASDKCSTSITQQSLHTSTGATGSTTAAASQLTTSVARTGSSSSSSSIQPHCVYSVCRVQQVSAQATRYKNAITLQMIELCNTASDGITGGNEWGGAWSRGCPLWKEYPEIAGQLQVSALKLCLSYCLLVSRYRSLLKLCYACSRRYKQIQAQCFRVCILEYAVYIRVLVYHSTAFALHSRLVLTKLRHGTNSHFDVCQRAGRCS
jgi:hypothetical protein